MRAGDSTIADAIDHAALHRMRAFHAFGIVAPLATAALSFLMGGNKIAQTAFCAGLCLLAATNVCMLLFVRTREATESRVVAALWAIGGLGVWPLLAYFG